MKTLFEILSVLALSSQAFANDGGMAVIDVKDLESNKGEVAITLKGGDAANLMKILPAEASALSAMKNHFKSLGITNNANSLVISCADAKVDEETFKVIPLKREDINCTISFAAASEGEFGDAFKFIPSKHSCRK